MMTDPVGDMFARLRNAALARHEVAKIPASKIKKAIAEILKQQGYVSDVREDAEEGKHQSLTIVLKYSSDKKAAFRGLRRVSRPGRRVYVRHDEIPRVLSGMGVSILSTSSGLMTDEDARRRKIGGELLCEVW